MTAKLTYIYANGERQPCVLSFHCRDEAEAHKKAVLDNLGDIVDCEIESDDPLPRKQRVPLRCRFGWHGPFSPPFMAMDHTGSFQRMCWCQRCGKEFVA